MSENNSAIVLASGSPRRKDLLEAAGYEFVVDVPEVVEIEDPAIEIRELTAINAKLKADAVVKKHPGSVVIAADTLVLFQGEALGKPADMTEAAQMLARLNGNSHQVYTAVCLLEADTLKTLEFDVATEVTFKKLSDDQMRKYHSLIDPLDKAGSYAAQEHGELIIEKSVGSSTNVIGLPMDELAEMLSRQFGIVSSLSDKQVLPKRN